jgi:glutamyl-tRNA synthetase
MIIHGGRTRLAPTPSGYLHEGNAFNFLVTALLAEHLGSTLVLRIDDLDAERVRPEYVDDIFLSLEWLGIRVDEGPSGPEDLARSWSQAHRIPRYMELFDTLNQHGLMYPCSCSRAEMMNWSAGRSPHLCRTSDPGPVRSGTPWRLRIPHSCPTTILDLAGHGGTLDPAALMEDPVMLIRGTGRPAYQLASLADDVDSGITFIVRGHDLLPSSVLQSHIAGRLGLASFSEVRFLHHPLTIGQDGKKLSKSAGASSLRAMREAGERSEGLRQQAESYVEGVLQEFNT